MGQIRGLALLITLLLLALLSLMTATLGRHILDEQRLTSVAADNLRDFWWAEELLLTAESDAARLDIQHAVACANLPYAWFPVRQCSLRGCHTIELLDASAALPAGEGRLYRLSVAVRARRRVHTLLQSHFIVAYPCLADHPLPQMLNRYGKRISWQHWSSGAQ